MTSLGLRDMATACRPRQLKLVLGRFQESQLGARLARGALWSLAGAIISRGLTLLTYIVVARLLGSEQFGKLGMVRSTVDMFTLLAGFGLGATATKHVAQFRRCAPNRAGAILALSWLVALASGLFMAAALCVSAHVVAAHALQAADLDILLQMSCVLLVVGAINGSQNGALAGFEAFRTIAGVNLLVAFVAFPLLVLGAQLGGLTGTVAGMTAAGLMGWTISHFAVRREAARWGVRLRFAGAGSERDILWRFSLPAALTSAVIGPTHWIIAVLLVRSPNGYEELGIFTAASQWRAAILFVPSAVSAVALPMLSDLAGSRSQLQYRKIMRANLLLNGGTALAIAVPTALLAPWIMSSYGPAFVRGSMVLVILALSSVLLAVTGVGKHVFASQGRMWQAFLLYLLWLITSIWSAWLFVEHGAVGIAASVLLSQCVHAAGVFACIKFLSGRPDTTGTESRIASSNSLEERLGSAQC